jgi:hypothetical protein
MDHQNRTSAHFLVGDKLPKLALGLFEEVQGILQTQTASENGVPYLASHLNNHYLSSFDGDHYFINALNKLGLVGPNTHSVLSEIYEGPKVDPNFRTIAVEIMGFDFDAQENTPSSQKIANVLSVVWGLMKRYRIRALDILGHNEIHWMRPTVTLA